MYSLYSVTEAFVTWLADLGFDASTYPPKTGTEFVTVERTGGYVEDLVDHPTIAIQAWAATDVRAEEMANAIRFEALTGARPEGVHRIDVNTGPYPFWDEYTKMPRYQVVLDCVAQLES